MARETRTSDQFDVDGLRQLLELMEKHDVREFKLQRGDTRYVVRRGPQEVLAVAPGAVHRQPIGPGPDAGTAPGSETTGPSGGKSVDTSPGVSGEENLLKITSPTVGTFYLSPAPGEPAFVKVGDTVKADTVVCIVEAMKVFNQIPAGISGTIAKVLLKDGDAVEFGQPLFLVKA